MDERLARAAVRVSRCERGRSTTDHGEDRAAQVSRSPRRSRGRARWRALATSPAPDHHPTSTAADSAGACAGKNDTFTGGAPSDEPRRRSATSVRRAAWDQERPDLHDELGPFGLRPVTHRWHYERRHRIPTSCARQPAARHHDSVLPLLVAIAAPRTPQCKPRISVASTRCSRHCHHQDARIRAPSCRRCRNAPRGASRDIMIIAPSLLNGSQVLRELADAATR